MENKNHFPGSSNEEKTLLEVWGKTLTGEESPGETIKNEPKDFTLLDLSIPKTVLSSDEALPPTVIEKLGTPRDSRLPLERTIPLSAAQDENGGEETIKEEIMGHPDDVQGENTEKTLLETPTEQAEVGCETDISAPVQANLSFSDTRNHPASESPKISPSSSSDFVLLREIGRGGMGIVYLAYQSSLKREVAIKMVHGEQNQPEVKNRFISEAMVTGELDHPNIVPVHLLASDQKGSTYMAMKRIVGFSWKELLHPVKEGERQKASSMGLMDHLDILVKVCDAVSFAHARNIVHRDLKPANVMIGNFGEVLVMDWGIAIDISDEIKTPQKLEHKTQATQPAGTPNYMAPEMALGDHQRLGYTTDVYLLGAILYEILTGEPPHRGENIFEIIHAALNSNVEPPEKKKPESNIPKELSDIAMKAIQKEPENRYKSVQDFQKAIRQYMGHHESVQISGKARKILDGLKEKGKSGGLVLGQVYLDCEDAYNSFKRALEVWPDNKTAYEGAIEAVQIQSQWAIHHQDIHIAGLQLQKLKQLVPPPTHFIKKIEQEVKRSKNSRSSTLIGIGLALVLFLIGYLAVRLWEEEDKKNSLEWEKKSQVKREVENVKRARQSEDGMSMLKSLSELKWKKEVAHLDLDALRQNAIETSFQQGEYKTAKLLILQHMEWAIDRWPTSLQLETQELPFFDSLNPTIQSQIRQDLKMISVLKNLMRYAEMGWGSGLELSGIWGKYRSALSEQESKKKQALPADHPLLSLAFLCLSAQAHQAHGKEDMAREEQIAALNFPVTFVLWEMLCSIRETEKIKEKVRPDVRGLLETAEKHPWKFSRETSGLEGRPHNLLCVTDRRELTPRWIFPEVDLHFSPSNYLFSPQEMKVYIGWGNFFFVLDAIDGKVLQRHKTGMEISYLRPEGEKINIECKSQGIDEGPFSLSSGLVVYDKSQNVLTGAYLPSGHFRLESQKRLETFERLKKRRFETGPSASELAWLHSIQGEKAEKLARILEEIGKKDQTNEFDSFFEGLAAHALGNQEKADVCWQKALGSERFSVYEAIEMALLFEAKGLSNWEDLFFEKAREIQARTFRNPDISVNLLSSPVYRLRRAAWEYFKKGEEKRGIDLFEKGIPFATFMEGDYLAYNTSFSSWARKQSDPSWKEKFRARARIALENGGSLFIASPFLGIAMEFLIPASILFTFLFFSLFFYFWGKYRQPRRHDLSSLGYRNVFSRNLAFLTAPVTRLRYTFFSYMKRGERICLFTFTVSLFSISLLLLAFLYQVYEVAKLPSSFANGYMGTPESMEYLEKIQGKERAESRDLLSGEGAYQARQWEKAREYFERAASHPLAVNNLGCIALQQGKPEAARDRFMKIRENEGLSGWIANANLSLLDKKEVPSDILAKLPLKYRDMLRHNPQGPLAMQCDYPRLQAILGTESRNIWDHVVKILSTRHQAQAVIQLIMAIDMSPSNEFLIVLWSITLALVIKMRWVIAILILVQLVSLFARVKSSSLEPHWLKRVAWKFFCLFGNFFPGFPLILKGRPMAGTLLSLLSLACYSSIVCLAMGGPLASISARQFPFVQVDDSLHPVHVYAGWAGAVVLTLAVVLSFVYGFRKARPQETFLKKREI